MTTYAATEKQLAFIDKLLQEKDLTGTSFADEPRPPYLDKRTASNAIDMLMALPRKRTTADAAVAASPAFVDMEGMHKVGDRIFKVQKAVHGSGNLYAKELLPVERDNVEIEDGVWKTVTVHRFEYAPGAIKRFALGRTTKMTLEQAKEFGALYGTCCVCARTLTNEESIEAGIGPVCGSRLA